MAVIFGSSHEHMRPQLAISTVDHEDTFPTQAPLPEAPQMPPSTFVPLALPAPAVDGEIQIELQRAGTTVKIVWPAGAARECAVWLRDWLR